MGMAAALKARQSLENAARVVGLEVLAAAQGLEFLKPLRPGAGPRAAYEFVRSGIPPLVEDRSLAPDANRILEWLATGQFLEAVETAAGRLACSLDGALQRADTDSAANQAGGARIV